VTLANGLAHHAEDAAMPAEFFFTDDKQLIRIRAHGQRSPAEMRETLATIARLHKEHGVNRVLGDAREQLTRLTLGEAYDLGKYEAETLGGRVRIAVVLSAKSEMLDFLETVAVNRGGQLSYFTDFDAAQWWLGATA
jgi:hypothetical protein